MDLKINPLMLEGVREEKTVSDLSNFSFLKRLKISRLVLGL